LTATFMVYPVLRKTMNVAVNLRGVLR